MKINLFKMLPLIACILLCTQTAFGVFEVKPQVDKITKVGNTDIAERNLSIDDMLHLDNKAIQQKTGKKLKFKEKLALRIARKKIKKARKKGKSDAEIKTLLEESKGGSKAGAFLLGFLVGLIGVLLTYLLMDKQYVKNAWMGFGVFLVIYLIIILIAVNNSN